MTKYFDSEKFEYKCQIKMGSSSLDLQVISLEGQEYISLPYEFTVKVLSANKIVIHDLESSSVMLSIILANQQRSISGVLSKFSLLDMIGEQDDAQYIYTLTLVPKVSLLKMYHDTDFYMKQSIIDVFKQVMDFANISPDYYSFDLDVKNYPVHDFIVQYQENSFDFISRLLEEAGIYYYFDHTTPHDSKLVLCDSIAKQPSLDSYLTFRSKKNNVDATFVQDFIFNKHPIPKKIIVRGYNHLTPSQEISAQYTLPAGYGEQYYSGELITSNVQAEHTAKIRAEAISSQHEVYKCVSNAPQLYPGVCFKLKNHFNAESNQDYQVVSIKHSGRVATEGVSGSMDKADNGYINYVYCITSDTQFRSQIRTYRPKIHGTIIGEIISNSEGQYADVNKYGEYKVKFRYDKTHSDQDTDYHWIRMMQPYGGPSGQKEGHQMVLRKGAEVMIGFINGEPRQPVILGVVPNAKNITVVQDPTQHKTVTPGGHEQTISDKEGECFTRTTQNNSSIHIGNYSDDNEVAK